MARGMISVIAVFQVFIDNMINRHMYSEKMYNRSTYSVQEAMKITRRHV